jgi:hypothetical protein
MSLRMPQNLSTLPLLRTGVATLEAEMAAEQASALGRTGLDLETALERLRAFDGAGAGDRAERAALVQAAADAAFSYIVQRETIGVYDHRLAIRDYAIPSEVLNRVGARSASGGRIRPAG